MQAFFDFIQSVIDFISGAISTFTGSANNWFSAQQQVGAFVTKLMGHQPDMLSGFYGFLLFACTFAVIVKVTPFIG